VTAKVLYVSETLAVLPCAKGKIKKLKFYFSGVLS